ncbi:MAG: cytochrome c biogenesis protein ResB [Candidatus Bipolaricaulia bacterium]
MSEVGYSTEATAVSERERNQRGNGSRLWRFFISVRLAIVLISLIVVIGIISTFIPQEPMTREVDSIARYGLAKYQTLKRLGLTDIFHTWYFYMVALLFTINLTACTYKRLKASLRYFNGPMVCKTPRAIERMNLHEQVAFNDLAPEAVKDRIKAALRSRHYRVREVDGQLLAEKWRWERFGIDVFHVGLLALTIGLAITGAFKFETLQIAYRGDIIQAPRGFSIRVDNFWSENYKDSEQVMDWHTQLTVLEDDREVLTQTIEVNHPLTYKGISFYQSAFGSDWQGASYLSFLMEDNNGTEIGEFEGVKVGTGFPVSDEAVIVAFRAFLPDFALSEDGRAYSRTQRLINPAAYLEVYDGEGEFMFRTWSFTRPDMQMLMAQHGPDLPYRFQIVGMRADEFTGIEINHDPGLPIAYTGFILMIIGILAHLYFKHKMVWVHFGDGRMLIGAKARKDPTEFEEEFEEIVEALKTAEPEISRRE